MQQSFTFLARYPCEKCANHRACVTGARSLTDEQRRSLTRRESARFFARRAVSDGKIFLFVCKNCALAATAAMWASVMESENDVGQSLVTALKGNLEICSRPHFRCRGDRDESLA